MGTPSGKTPVSILNEYMMSKGYVPKFELVMNGVGMQKPSFAYVVQCGNRTAAGMGRSKQEAKHLAARNMLDMLQLSGDQEYKEEVKQLVVPYDNSVGYNAVGALSEYCKKNCYPEAVYDEIGEVGMPHDKTFTMKCSVSKLSTVGEYRTKKEAKQIAAHKMLTQLQLEAGEEPMAVAIPKKPAPVVPETVDLPKVTSIYQPRAHLYKDFCNAYVDLSEKSETLAKILNNWDDVTMKNACKYVLDISKEFAVDLVIEKMENFVFKELPLDVLERDYDINYSTLTISKEQKDNMPFVFITMQLHPPVVSLEKDVPEAALSLLEYLKELST